jgi:hypothetical protein
MRIYQLYVCRHECMYVLVVLCKMVYDECECVRTCLHTSSAVDPFCIHSGSFLYYLFISFMSVCALHVLYPACVIF